jgi:beta-glucosidase/6-phospho-beta-glucosidase/beta-galactosidase
MAHFPDEYLWGASTAAHQTEGNGIATTDDARRIAVDRTTFARAPKPSLAWLGEVARTNGTGI